LKYFLFALSIVCVSCASYSEYVPSNYVIVINKITDRYVKDTEEKYNVSLFGSGGGMMYNVNNIFLSFHVIKEVKLEEARKMYVEMVSDLLNRINQDEEVRPYLSHFPYTAKGVSIQLVFFSHPDISPPPENIAIVSMLNGNIRYGINNPKTELYVDIHQETYDDAVRIVNSQNQTYDTTVR